MVEIPEHLRKRAEEARAKAEAAKGGSVAETAKEKSLFRNQRKAVEAGANGTLDYTIKEGINKNKIADQKILKSKK